MWYTPARLPSPPVSTPKINGIVGGEKPCRDQRRKACHGSLAKRSDRPGRLHAHGARRTNTSGGRVWRWNCRDHRGCLRPRRPGAWAFTSRPCADGDSAGLPKGSPLRTSRIRGVRRLFPPRVRAQVKAIACELPLERGLPLSRLSVADIRQVLLSEDAVDAISSSTVWRWLDADSLRPWRHHCWIFPRDPDFVRKAGRVLDLYQGVWDGAPLGANDYVISADEKTSIQARHRRHPTTPPQPGQAMRVEHEYRRGGAVAYLAALDVFGGRVIGRVSLKTGIEPFNALVDLVMRQEPYAGADRVFWVVDNGSSHRPGTFPARLASRHPNAIAVHLPIHASWLNQIEIFFSILQRKVLTPNDFLDTDAVRECLLRFEARYNATAQPFQWNYTRDKLDALMQRLDHAA